MCLDCLDGCPIGARVNFRPRRGLACGPADVRSGPAAGAGGARRRRLRAWSALRTRRRCAGACRPLPAPPGATEDDQSSADLPALRRVREGLPDRAALQPACDSSAGWRDCGHRCWSRASATATTRCNACGQVCRSGAIPPAGPGAQAPAGHRRGGHRSGSLPALGRGHGDASCARRCARCRRRPIRLEEVDGRRTRRATGRTCSGRTSCATSASAAASASTSARLRGKQPSAVLSEPHGGRGEGRGHGGQGEGEARGAARDWAGNPPGLAPTNDLKSLHQRRRKACLHCEW